MASYTIRKGEERDLPGVLALIQELADYERASDEVDNSVEQLRQDAFGPKPVFEFYVAELAEGALAGLALYFYSYSTWKGTCVYLEDLIVTQEQRGQGIGKALFDTLAKHAKSIGAARLMWQVLDWNEPAIGFYKEVLCAELDETWINCKLTAEQLQCYPD